MLRRDGLWSPLPSFRHWGCGLASSWSATASAAGAAAYATWLRCPLARMQVAVLMKKRKARPAEQPAPAAAEQPAPDRSTAAPVAARRAASDALHLASPGKAAAAAAAGSELAKASSDSLAARPGSSSRAGKPEPFTLLPGYASRPNSSPQRLSPSHTGDAPAEPSTGPQPRAVKRQLPFSEAAPADSRPARAASIQLGRAASGQAAAPDRKDSGSAVAQVEHWKAASQTLAAAGPPQRSPARSPGAQAQQDILAALTSELLSAPVSRPSEQPERCTAELQALAAAAAEAETEAAAKAAGPRPKAKKRGRSAFQACDAAACFSHLCRWLISPDVQGTGTVAVSAKRAGTQPVTAKWAAAAEQLPLPPVLERLNGIFGALNLVYQLLLNNHIQVRAAAGKCSSSVHLALLWAPLAE